MSKSKGGLFRFVRGLRHHGNSWLIGGLIGGLYGLVSRILFGLSVMSDLVSTLSIGFLVFVPLSIGAVAVFFSPDDERVSYKYALGAAFAAGLAFLMLALIFLLEIGICILMAAPFVLIAAVLGGVIMCWAIRQRTRNYAYLGILLMLPYLLTPAEVRLIPAADSIRSVYTHITIDAPAETVWQHIIRVAEIQPAERPFHLLRLAGTPNALEATLDYEGVGGMRYATFDNGLAFLETITEWQPSARLAFTIALDSNADNPAPYNTIGGPTFAMLDATYQLEPLAGGQTRLHLTSTHRLTTRFNFYGGAWTDAIMRDIQDTILRVVKQRCEAEGTKQLPET